MYSAHLDRFHIELNCVIDNRHIVGSWTEMDPFDGLMYISLDLSFDYVHSVHPTRIKYSYKASAIRLVLSIHRFWIDLQRTSTFIVE